jgi:hypothetical protein
VNAAVRTSEPAQVSIFRLHNTIHDRERQDSSYCREVAVIEHTVPHHVDKHGQTNKKKVSSNKINPTESDIIHIMTLLKMSHTFSFISDCFNLREGTLDITE